MQIVINTLLSKIKKYNPELNEAQISSRKFGLEILINELSKVIIYLIIFSIISQTGYYLLSLCIYSSIRLATGGYHAKSYLGCLIVSFIIFSAAVLSGRYITLIMPIKAALLLVSLNITAIYAPVEHKNITQKNRRRRKTFKWLSLLLVIFWSCFSFLLPGGWGVTAIATIFFEALMQPVGKWFNPVIRAEFRG